MSINELPWQPRLALFVLTTLAGAFISGVGVYLWGAYVNPAHPWPGIFLGPLVALPLRYVLDQGLPPPERSP